MIATMNYVDEVKGLYERLNQLQSVKSGVDLLEKVIEIWGNYIPEIYGLAKAMLMTKDTDEAMAAAWDNSMGCLRDVCQQSINMLAQEDKLVAAWSIEEATDMFVTIVSISGWEQLVKECNWSNEQYINSIKTLLVRTFVA